MSKQSVKTILLKTVIIFEYPTFHVIQVLVYCLHYTYIFVKQAYKFETFIVFVGNTFAQVKVLRDSQPQKYNTSIIIT